MIELSVERARIGLVVLCMALLLPINLAAAEPYRSWIQLTPIQHEALQPLAGQWDSLPIKLQDHLLHAASRYQKLTPEQKQRFQSRLIKWSKLTPEQRERARIKYQTIKKSSPETGEQLKRRMREQDTGKTFASSVPSDTSMHLQ